MLYSQLFDQCLASLENPLAKVSRLPGFGQTLILLELGEAARSLREPVLLLDVFEVGLGDVLRVAKQERSLFDKNRTRCAPVSPNSLLLVKLIFRGLQALPHNVAANQ